MIILLCWFKGKVTSNENATMRSGAHGMGVTLFQDTKPRHPSPLSTVLERDQRGHRSRFGGVRYCVAIRKASVQKAEDCAKMKDIIIKDRPMRI